MRHRKDDLRTERVGLAKANEVGGEVAGLADAGERTGVYLDDLGSSGAERRSRTF